MLIVETPDLRRALTACLAVVPTEKDDPRRRLRIEVTDHNVYVVATDLWSVALAIVSVVDCHDDMAGLVLDLGIDEAGKILAVHKPRATGGSGAGLEEEQLLALDLTVDSEGVQSLRSRDVSGLFPGDEQLVVPLAGETSRFPDVTGTLGSIAGSHARSPGRYDGGPLVLFPDRLTALTKASKTYKKPIAFRVVSRQGSSTLLATVGDSFMAAVRAEQPDLEREYHVDVVQAWDGWLQRLPMQPRPGFDVNLDDHPTEVYAAEHTDDMDEAGEAGQGKADDELSTRRQHRTKNDDDPNQED